VRIESIRNRVLDWMAGRERTMVEVISLVYMLY
jgi:hypothetical protein